MTPTDPITLLATLLPPPWATYLAWAVGIASIVSFSASAFTAAVKPPVTSSPAWWVAVYRGISWAALNLNWSRNAVVPGMPVQVQAAAKVAAQIAAAAPHLTEVAVEPAVAGAIVTAVPAVPASAVPFIGKVPG